MSPQFRTLPSGLPGPSFQQLLQKPSALLAFGFGSGLSPKAPGTAGTLAAVPFLWGLNQLSLYTYLGVTLVAFLLGVWLCERCSRWLGVHDHGGIVWDEFVGFWIACIALPPGWLWLLAAFALFRFFDALKPWPISWLDKNLHGGFGIMVDDVAAGVASLICLQVAAVWLP
jgi:phosphatidylglycerophosphatase A